MIFDENYPIKVVLADDHEIVRAGIKRLLSVDKSIKVVAEAQNGAEAIEAVQYHKPDIALLDILMPVMTGIEAVKNIKTTLPETFTVILTAFEDSKHLELALNTGADGYLTKDIKAKDLTEAMHKVMEGERVFSKSILLILQNHYVTKSHIEEPPISITKREQDILNLVADGLTSNDIAQELSLSIRTIESHRYNLMQKLNLKSTAQLIKYAIMYNTERRTN
ncbi:MAG TPA: response regulator transcription factor [Candidatus Kapabacteria bacterium]|nr:response regulator transcription factor [Candidatus Kapabacteria bacterium]